MLKDIKKELVTLDACLYWNDIRSEYALGVWTLNELAQGVEFNIGNATSKEYQNDLVRILQELKG